MESSSAIHITHRDFVRYRYAQRLAQTHNSYGKFRMVSVAYKGKKLLQIGKNYYPARRSGYSVNDLYFGIGLHAEASILTRPVMHRSNSVTMVIAGFNKNDRAIISKPCPRCSLILTDIHWLKDIVYWDGTTLVKVLRNELELNPIPIYY